MSFRYGIDKSGNAYANDLALLKCNFDTVLINRETSYANDLALLKWVTACAVTQTNPPCFGTAIKFILLNFESNPKITHDL